MGKNRLWARFALSIVATVLTVALVEAGCWGLEFVLWGAPYPGG